MYKKKIMVFMYLNGLRIKKKAINYTDICFRCCCFQNNKLNNCVITLFEITINHELQIFECH